MSKQSYSYNTNFLVLAIIIWEAVFWGLYFLITNSLGLLSGANSERLLYKFPETLWAVGVLIPIIATFLYNAYRNNQSSENLPQRVAQSYLKPVSTMNNFLRYFLFRNAIIFLIIALAQPVFGKQKAAGTVDDLELVICLDVSNSMNTKDISPDISRLEISKRAIEQLIKNLHGERIGICLFANNAFVQLPVTRDYQAAKMFVKDIETNMISSQGTNIDAALKVSLEMFSKERTGKGIIMITDGENHESDPNQVLTKIRKSKVQLSILGIGTKRGGLVPKDPKRPELGYKKTATGKAVLSKLDESFIRKTASKGGGKASLSSNEFPDLSALLTQINRMKRTKIDNLEFDIRQEGYQTPLVISLVFWLAYLLWSKKYVGVLDKLIQKR
ncbi:MAG: VWA domain-containing protein [Crocinitomicaceae bacterium]|nr:VWA domain-containing protein [Crocinitomicaceae bacterium]